MDETIERMMQSGGKIMTQLTEIDEIGMVFCFFGGDGKGISSTLSETCNNGIIGEGRNNATMKSGSMQILLPPKLNNTTAG
ncbi:hypothetical protein AWU65_24355 [Paenibacillus glucanolyticus]|uniref:Uncharacterized protein n=1 Tax=Paenibacillus glucanolyticus TaxID=59843 RepID=A0A163M8P2_9BACL|nr:hypothetical protein [Paenibacillus glucanolyticus]KZS48843.1 hypothetical protein AWU65_24355 [Paenibacillus glucanolyticus]